MNRGELPLVDLDDRTWQELVDQTKSLIPTYAPEWTDNGPADLGITLVELFAWLVEGMQYRLNRVPDRTYAALLNLMGILRKSPHPASTMLTFSLAKGPPLLIERFLPVSSLQTEQQTAIIFETDEDLEVLPANLRWALQLGSDGKVEDIARNLIQSPLNGWKFALPKNQSVCLLLGFDVAPAKEFSLKVRPPALQNQLANQLAKPLPTTTLAGAMNSDSATLMVASTAGFLINDTKPFTIQIDNEQLLVKAWQVQSVSTLTEKLVSTAPSLKVASLAGFPPAPPAFAIQMDNEQLSVTAGPPNTTWSVLRGLNGTKPADHAANAAVIFPSIWTVQRGQNGTTASAHSLNAEVTIPAVALAWSYPTGPTTTLTEDVDGVTNPAILKVASAAGFPATAPFTIQIGNEQLQVTSEQNSTTWTATRAQNGTVISKHSKTAVVTLPLNTIAPKSIQDGSNALRRAGSVLLPKLDDWVARLGSAMVPGLAPDSLLGRQSAFWLQLKITANSSFDVSVGLDFLLANSVSASHVITVPQTNPEQARNITPNAPNTDVVSDQPWQRFELKNRSLYRQPNSANPYSDLQVVVSELSPQGVFQDFTDWKLVDDFPPGRVKCYRLDPVSGTLQFGDYTDKQGKGFGLIPPTGSRVMVSYRAVAGGKAGNVPPGVLVTLLPRPGDTLPNDTLRPNNLLSVTNPGIGVAGADEEPIEETKRRAPDVLRVRNRAVTAEDYASLAHEASTLVKKSAALATPRNWQDWEGHGGLQRRPGFVNVLIVPDAPASEPQPIPSAALIDEVRAYLDERRVVSTSLAVMPPRYAPVAVDLNVKLFPGPGKNPNLIDTLKKGLLDTLKGYLHPLLGGPNGQGWEIGDTLFVSGLFAAIEPLIGTQGFVKELTVALNPPRPSEDDVLIKEKVNRAVGQQVLDFELICSAANHNVTVEFLPS